MAELGKNPDSECHSSSVYFVSTAALAMDPGVPESAIPLRTFTLKGFKSLLMSFHRSLNVMCSCNPESLAHGFIALTDDSVLYSQNYIYFTGGKMERPQNTRLVSNSKVIHPGEVVTQI